MVKDTDMKQFNLEEYLRLKEAGNEPKLVTRIGRSARIVCTDVKGTEYSILALVIIEGEECTRFFTENGRFISDEDDNASDLFFADLDEEPTYRPYKNAEECFADVKKHGGWIISAGNQYRQITGICYGCNSNIVKMNGCNWMSFGELLGAVWADDGSPCGVMEE